ncbi:MAG: hypothetical protein COB29_04165 [Sulfitobacter sp.]|jgi:hypothetical protein|nr:hypothetical protein [Roseobacter sp.]MBV49551.1 hypothetical protein [Roseobacter sp.]PHR09512.1 MAG: hypothetical protein COB29_04165 [Sulfitobacter sp.]
MHRRFIAIIVASAIAVTAATVSPAIAGSKERDLARIAAGVLGVAIIGKLIHDNNKRKEARQQAVTRQYADPVPVYRAPRAKHREHVDREPVYRAPRAEHREHAKPAPVHRVPRAEQHHDHPQPKHRVPRVGTGNHIEPRPLPEAYRRQQNYSRVDEKLLPQECFQSFDTRSGRVLMFGERCLQQNYQYANRLPQQCGQEIRTHNGRQYGYDARCLRNAGYSLARG